MLTLGSLAEWIRRPRRNPPARAFDATLAIDLVRLLPGGDHGGAKVLALELLSALRREAPTLRQLILTGHATHAELKPFEKRGVTRLCVQEHPDAWQACCAGARGARAPLLLLLTVLGRPSVPCAGLPIVALVTQVECLRYPERLSAFERRAQRAELRSWAPACLKLLCLSSDDAAALEQTLGLAADRIQPVRLRPEARLARRGLWPRGVRLARPYVFYPANYWPHKNHQLLLVAYGARRAAGASLPHLVCAGAAEGVRLELVEMVRRMGLTGHVTLLPAVDAPRLGALYRDCQGVVLPWLYAGHGLPLLEAARYGLPISCSRFTRVPAGLPVRLFDPRSVKEIGEALEYTPERAPAWHAPAAEAGLLDSLRGALGQLATARA